MIINPNIYEINSRVWINRFHPHNNILSISQVPDKYWMNLKNLGMDFIWLMGVWETVPSSIDKYCFTPGLIDEYRKALPDWKKEDIIGSPYAINDYKLNSILGITEELYSLKKRLNSLGLKLILDFIPNHFHADSQLLKSNPEIFLQADEEHYLKDQLTFYKPENQDNYFAHGKDPNFTAWQDTVQVNYFSSKARTYMKNQLLKLTEVCDGVRCDMAMLILNNSFEKTWGKVIDKNGSLKPADEFWYEAINKVKNKSKDFIFIAEAYWGLEWELQQQGFDYTYDKSLYDRLKNQNAQAVNDHLKANKEYQLKSVRFIENHDEQRSASAFGEEKSQAASIITSTIPGMHLFHDGQFEGKTIKMPAQLGREPHESINVEIEKLYKKLFDIVNIIDAKNSKWELMKCEPAGKDDTTKNNFVVYKWLGNKKVYIFIINYSDQKSYCRLILDIQTSLEQVVLLDKLAGESYERPVGELNNQGLFVALDKFKSHIFEIVL